jgi:hypothetical protein
VSQLQRFEQQPGWSQLHHTGMNSEFNYRWEGAAPLAASSFISRDTFTSHSFSARPREKEARWQTSL